MIKVMYSCNKCNIKDRAVQIPVREPEEDITHWVSQTVGTHLAMDHVLVSPGCKITEFSEVKIPLDPGEETIGFGTSH